MSDLLPPGPELFAANQRVLAERLGWPLGAVEACQSIDEEFPGWYTLYWPVHRGKPAGYYAFHDNSNWMEPHLYGATPDDLREAIRTHRCPSRWT
ncbi:hypothetical protein GCM10009557_11570 [Virgisporangium ochraceum]|uniref:Uncharacterized protein n=1 Tax=Virgisporangium ochraceum TaxID=65505 RepID=A0A8J3ZXC3_9ACTN|nr:hypothetical protein [Virgisporangium ochraceum]GIJ69893.1 hypothetical protein Voc01_048100 [Virgisporangium ochraceum]